MSYRNTDNYPNNNIIKKNNNTDISNNSNELKNTLDLIHQTLISLRLESASSPAPSAPLSAAKASLSAARTSLLSAVRRASPPAARRASLSKSSSASGAPSSAATAEAEAREKAKLIKYAQMLWSNEFRDLNEKDEFYKNYSQLSAASKREVFRLGANLNEKKFFPLDNYSPPPTIRFKPVGPPPPPFSRRRADTEGNIRGPVRRRVRSTQL